MAASKRGELPCFKWAVRCWSIYSCRDNFGSVPSNGTGSAESNLGDVRKVGDISCELWNVFCWWCDRDWWLLSYMFLIQIMDRFRRLGFPHCATDGTHIPIIIPTKAYDEYINRQSYHSILLQGSTDHIGWFTDIEVGWSGPNQYAHCS